MPAENRVVREYTLRCRAMLHPGPAAVIAGREGVTHEGDPQSIWYHTDADVVGFRVVRPLRVPTTEEAARYDLDQTQIDAMAEYLKRR